LRDGWDYSLEKEGNVAALDRSVSMEQIDACRSL
jgi:hypothetical protein